MFFYHYQSDLKLNLAVSKTDFKVQLTQTMNSQFNIKSSEDPAPSTQSENSMVQSTDIYNTGALASSTHMFQRLTIQENTERLQQSTFNVSSPAPANTFSLPQGRSPLCDLSTCICQNPQLRNIEYEMAEQMEWQRYNDDPYYSSLDYDSIRGPEYMPEHEPEFEAQYQQELEAEYHSEYMSEFQPDLLAEYQPEYVSQYQPQLVAEFQPEHQAEEPNRMSQDENHNDIIPDGVRAIWQMFDENTDPSDENNNSV